MDPCAARYPGTSPGERPACPGCRAGCGSGWASIALARAYPAARVDGIDLDEASIVQARHNAEHAQLGDRIQFDCRDASDPALAGRYDLVMLFETLHDMANPVAVLRAAGAMLARGGAVLIGDEKAAETFTAPGTSSSDSPTVLAHSTASPRA